MFDTLTDDLHGRMLHSPKWAEGNLSIKTKAAHIEPLRYNPIQWRLEKIFEEERKAGRPIRLLGYKARQEGFSTWTESVIYDWIHNVPQTEAAIVADSPDSTNNLYDMFRRFHDHNPNPRETEHQHQKGLKFPEPHGSRVVVSTAKRKYVGTGRTTQLGHLSEISKWDDPETTMLSFMQGVPDLPGTLVVVESTANGAGDYFNSFWEAAERGENEWRPVFFSWFDLPEYQRDPTLEDMTGLGTEEKYNLYPGEEVDLLQRHQVTEAQLAWRRWCIRNKCRGNILMFHQEYPSSPEEGFVASGNPRFSVPALQRMRTEVIDPRFVGDVILTDDKPELIEYEGQFVYLWDFPQPGHRYAIGADCKGSSPLGDYNAAVILDKDVSPHPVVGVLYGIGDADTFATKLCLMARFYNQAVLAIEKNGVGEAVLQPALRIYSNHYHRPVKRGELVVPGDDPGWWTGAGTRGVLIEDLAAAVRDSALRIPADLVLREMLAFHTVPGVRGAEAKLGSHDDFVFALGIALQALNYSAFDQLRVGNAESAVVQAGHMSEIFQ